MLGECGTYGNRRGAYRVVMGKPKQEVHLEDLVMYGRVILKLILKKYNEAKIPLT